MEPITQREQLRAAIESIAGHPVNDFEVEHIAVTMPISAFSRPERSRVSSSMR